MIGDRLQQAADPRNKATDAVRKAVTVESTIVAGTEPAAGRARDPIADLRIRTLTKRERELLCLLANGWSNRRIANECRLSLHTVRTRVQNILVKLGVHSKLEAAAFAFEHGLVLPERIGRSQPCSDPHVALVRALSPHSASSSSTRPTRSPVTSHSTRPWSPARSE
jgi:DNA-binding CsgD family transcriptional regulator